METLWARRGGVLFFHQLIHLVEYSCPLTHHSSSQRRIVSVVKTDEPNPKDTYFFWSTYLMREKKYSSDYTR